MASDDRSGDDRPEDTTSVPDDELLAMARRGDEALDAVDSAHVAGLWEGIARAAFDDESSAGAEHTTGEDGTDDLPGLGPRPVVDGVGTPDSATGVEALDPVTRSRRGLRWAVGAVAAALVVVVGGVWLVQRGPDPVPVASFQLEALDDRASAVAGTVVSADGHTRVEVDLATLPATPQDTFYELWLLDAEAGRLVSLGPVEGQASFVVPAAVEIGDWPLLDVSVEPLDGDPTHSSDSVLRGEINVADGT